jgi:hypothetical protein
MVCFSQATAAPGYQRFGRRPNVEFDVIIHQLEPPRARKQLMSELASCVGNPRAADHKAAEEVAECHSPRRWR